MLPTDELPDDPPQPAISPAVEMASNKPATLAMLRGLPFVTRARSIARSIPESVTRGSDVGRGRWFAKGRRKEGAVVLTLTVTVAGDAPLSVIEEGETEQVDSIGAPEQANETWWLNPPIGERLTM
jgi:hypothetical protein